MTTTATEIRIKGIIGDEKVTKVLELNKDYVVLDDIGYASDYLFFPDYLNENNIDMKNVVVGFEYDGTVYAFSKNAIEELFEHKTPFFTHGLHIDADVEYITLTGYNKEFNEHIDFDLKYVFFGKKNPNCKAIRINSLSEFPIWRKIEVHLSRTMTPRELDLNELILPDAEEFI